MTADAVRRYMHMAEQRIGAAFLAERLHCHLAAGWQGPHTLTFSVKLYQPTAPNIAKAMRLGPAVEAMLGDGPVRIASQAGAILVETPSPWPVAVESARLRGTGMAVPVGISGRRTVEGIDLGDPNQAHILAVGPSGRGKTTALRSIAFHLARQNLPSQVRLLAITFKPADWRAVADLSHSWPMITDATEAEVALTALAEEVANRARLQVAEPHILIIVDDLLNLLALVNVGDQLGQIASLGRSAGVHLAIGTQRLGKRGAGDVAVTSNISTRMVFGTTDAADAAFFTGRADSGAEVLGRHPGDCLLVRDGQTIRLAAARVADGDLDSLPRSGPRYVRVWQPSSRGGGGGSAQKRPESPAETPSEALSTANTTTTTPPPDAEAERKARIKALAASGKSKSAICMEEFGYKDTRTYRIVAEALKEEVSA